MRITITTKPRHVTTIYVLQQKMIRKRSKIDIHTNIQYVDHKCLPIVCPVWTHINDSFLFEFHKILSIDS